MKYTLFFLLSFILVFASSCKGTKKTTQSVSNSSSSTPAKEQAAPQVSKDIPSFLARMIRDGRKADNAQSVKVDMFEKEGQQFYGYNNCNGCSDAMTIIYDITGKKIANCGGFAGFRGEYCEALAKAKTMYNCQNGKILVDEWKLGE